MAIKRIKATYRIDKIDSRSGANGCKKVAYVHVRGEGTESEVTGELMRLTRNQVDPATERVVLLEFCEK